MNRTGLVIALAVAAVVGVIFGLRPDLDLKLAVAFCHNRMFDTVEIAEDSRTLIGDVIRAAL